jgi:hypothetical protein
MLCPTALCACAPLTLTPAKPPTKNSPISTTRLTFTTTLTNRDCREKPAVICCNRKKFFPSSYCVRSRPSPFTIRTFAGSMVRHAYTRGNCHSITEKSGTTWNRVKHPPNGVGRKSRWGKPLFSLHLRLPHEYQRIQLHLSTYIFIYSEILK